ncbi:DUF4255 domain-containing protein [Knoellia aerolata]|uniref:Pvc16 N-terminal domain-containing protein n=1 Tax=Knoellia aerolata DSM 18566 TaxID=1385519 RepID=A0A0A0JX36_9MICO|nr:DUF4255 domain-containing protein [Knoellia aerolata]KGN41274.1 hypothetical protein N801_08575 [Knoellia aerolata DSM 18566]
MISAIDEALRGLIRSDVLDGSDVEVVLDAPTKDWAARRNAPTIDVYLYDIREDLRRRERGWVDVRGPDGSVVRRRPAPRHFKMSYLVTAWTQRPEDEHRLLSSLLRCFLKYDALPPELVVGPIAEAGLPVPVSVGLPPPEDRGFADVWSSLGGELKPSLDLVVIAPVEIGIDFPAGPPVQEGPIVDLADRSGGGRDPRRQKHVAPPRGAHGAEAHDGTGSRPITVKGAAGQPPRSRPRRGAR